jgi:hypothetical protein
MTLRPVAKSALINTEYDLARNGEHYHLVRTEPDDYGQPRAKRLDVGAYLTGDPLLVLDAKIVDAAQALLDVLGETVERVQALQAARERQLDRGGVTT